MGYRLHYAQSYTPNWQGGFFGGRSSDFADLVRDEFEHSFWMNEEESECELERADIQKYIDKLDKAPNEENEHFPAQFGDAGLTNKEVADNFREILKSDDDTIHMEWF